MKMTNIEDIEFKISAKTFYYAYIFIVIIMSFASFMGLYADFSTSDIAKAYIFQSTLIISQTIYA